MNIHFQYRQKKIILKWHEIANNAIKKKSIIDNYTAFIADWISFNAICYNLYSEKANKKIPYLKGRNIDKIFDKLNNTRAIEIKDIKDVNINKTGNKLKINIIFNLDDDPNKIDKENKNNNNDKCENCEKLLLEIKEKYTENIIFELFVKNNSDWYNKNPKFIELFENLKSSLIKKDCKVPFVINMSKEKAYTEFIKSNKIDSSNINKLADDNIIIKCDKNNLRTVKNVLYQIRSNIFHGEKFPSKGDDDKIVKSAFPLLNQMVSSLIKKYNIDKDR